MKRRDFLTLLASAMPSCAWPPAAHAPPPAKLPTIGFLGGNTPSVQNQWTGAFVQRLRELGGAGRAVFDDFDAAGFVARFVVRFAFPSSTFNSSAFFWAFLSSFFACFCASSMASLASVYACFADFSRFF